MKQFGVIALLLVYLFFIPDYFVEVATRICQLEEMGVRILKFIVMLGGVIAFVAFTPIAWFRSARLLK